MRTSMRASRKGSSQVCCTPAERAHMSVLHTHRVRACERAAHLPSVRMRSRASRKAELRAAEASPLEGVCASGKVLCAKNVSGKGTLSRRCHAQNPWWGARQPRPSQGSCQEF